MTSQGDILVRYMLPIKFYGVKHYSGWQLGAAPSLGWSPLPCRAEAGWSKLARHLLLTNGAKSWNLRELSPLLSLVGAGLPCWRVGGHMGCFPGQLQFFLPRLVLAGKMGTCLFMGMTRAVAAPQQLVLKQA